MIGSSRGLSWMSGMSHYEYTSTRLHAGHATVRQAPLTLEIILYWSEEDQAIIAEVPELPGCAADGATYQEAFANVQIIIAEWIETAQELGRPIPTPIGRLLFA
jgi:predicted RNase H-like HicB family nuclease